LDLKDDCTIVILAGGKSERMGSDKAILFNSVKRIQKLSEEIGVQRCIVICGTEDRKNLFEGEVWGDPEHSTSISDLIKWLREEISGRIQLLPCDCYLLERSGLEFLLEMKNGVPIDGEGCRQPLMANFDTNSKLVDSRTLNQLFSDLDSYENDQLAKQFSNFNTQEELNLILSEEQNS